VTSVNEYDGGVMLQCDVSHKIFRTETVLDVMKEIKRKCSQGAFRVELEKALLGAVVFTGYNYNTYKVDDIVKRLIGEDFFRVP